MILWFLLSKVGSFESKTLALLSCVDKEKTLFRVRTNYSKFNVHFPVASVVEFKQTMKENFLSSFF